MIHLRARTATDVEFPDIGARNHLLGPRVPKPQGVTRGAHDALYAPPGETNANGVTDHDHVVMAYPLRTHVRGNQRA